MTISTHILDGGVIRCYTEIDGRKYSRKFYCSNVISAKKLFRSRVKKAELRFASNLSKEIINTCLNCTVPVAKCKGDCKIKQKLKQRRQQNGRQNDSAQPH